MKKSLLFLIAFCFASTVLAQAPTTAPAQDPVYSLGNGVTAPKLVHSVEAGYTEQARKDKISGTVMIDFVVGKDGVPRNFQVIKSLGDGLDDSATSAISEYRYQPAMKDGAPVSVHFSATVTFTWTPNVQIWIPMRVPMGPTQPMQPMRY
jgi:TonB family protein